MKKTATAFLALMAMVIVVTILFAFLLLWRTSSLQTSDGKSQDNYQELPVTQCFVSVKTDTLKKYLEKYYANRSLKVYKDKLRKTLVIEYNKNNYILLHSRNDVAVDADRKRLEKGEKKGFAVKYDKRNVKISLKEHGDYVDCPALIIAEILEEKSKSK